ncbi:MAG: GyrI-like domain-containing protein, partial [Ktedonobacterales bacterium]
LISTEKARLQRITARLDQLTAAQGDDGQRDVILKRSEAQNLLGLRRRVIGQREIGPFANVVVTRLMAEELWPVSPLTHLYFDVGLDTEEFDLFVGAAVNDQPQDEAAWTRECLPAGELLACVIYRGDYAQIGAAFAALGRWMLASGYESIGPCREVYLRAPAHTNDPAEYVTEIQYPVASTQPKSASAQPEATER